MLPITVSDSSSSDEESQPVSLATMRADFKKYRSENRKNLGPQISNKSILSSIPKIVNLQTEKFDTSPTVKNQALSFSKQKSVNFSLESTTLRRDHSTMKSTSQAREGSQMSIRSKGILRKGTKRMSIKDRKSFFKNKLFSHDNLYSGAPSKMGNGSNFFISKGDNKLKIQVPQSNRKCILTNLVMKKFKTIIEENPRLQKSRMSTIFDHSVASEEDNDVYILDPNRVRDVMYFDVENPNMIIQRALK